MSLRRSGRRDYLSEASERVSRYSDALRPGCAAVPGRHFNPLSGTVYQGINHLLLSAALPAESADPRWLTLKQIDDLRQRFGDIRLANGAQAALAVFALPVTRGGAMPGDEAVYVLKGCSLFNGAQIMGLPPLAPPPDCDRAAGGGGVRLTEAVLNELGWADELNAFPALARHCLEEKELDEGAELLRRMAAAMLSWLPGFFGEMPDRRVPGSERAEGPLAVFRAAHAVERMWAWLGQRSPAAAAFERAGDEFVRANLLADPSAAEWKPAPAAAAAQSAARRGALWMDVSLLTVAESTQLTASHFGNQELLPETEAELYGRFQAWARQSIQSGIHDDLPITARELFGWFLSEEEGMVRDLLQLDDARRRQRRAATAIDMAVPGLAAAVAGRSAEISMPR
ncbi:ArdC-like ssDNA-binding domain-containing protein [Chromobacterium piscinae]|uniref:ArdC-like ssDNA-binding domain-containing protein n=1 Tax=Chromobacterium piscinae TaxID=686831 RepID=UPI001C8C3DF9|nr:ArdC-like ssDNA-binding domain-containing protein [Chromobacterium piscinae]MBX9295528.1 ArdC family protein [Chromobacterium vaccinii]MBX9355836.1 ArdC family protein [Chromobacterium vaccinii]MCD5326508.1 ArdC family protein [Chromobacterium piscinae]